VLIVRVVDKKLKVYEEYGIIVIIYPKTRKIMTILSLKSLK